MNSSKSRLKAVFGGNLRDFAIYAEILSGGTEKILLENGIVGDEIEKVREDAAEGLSGRVKLGII